MTVMKMVCKTYFEKYPFMHSFYPKISIRMKSESTTILINSNILFPSSTPFPDSTAAPSPHTPRYPKHPLPTCLVHLPQMSKGEDSSQQKLQPISFCPAISMAANQEFQRGFHWLLLVVKANMQGIVVLFCLFVFCFFLDWKFLVTFSQSKINLY